MSPTPYADATVLRLALLKAGQSRRLRVRLMEIRRNDKRPTDLFLDLSITCVLAGKTFQVDPRPDLGATLPQRATLTVVVGRGDALPPVALVEAGAVVPASFTLAIEPTSEWLTLWVAAEGGAFPGQLAGEVRLRQPDDERSADELDTARLPSLRSVMRQSLMGAFRRSPSPPLVLLGALMRSEDAAEKRDLLHQLVELDPDARLVEAAVRDIAFAEQFVRGFPPVDFGGLSCDDPTEAALAVFHPGSPLPVVRQCFAAAFSRQFASLNPAERQRWSALVKAGAVVICRKDRSLLDEGFAVATGIAADPTRSALFRSLVEWAWSHGTQSAHPLPKTLESYLTAIGGNDPAAAVEAACEVMAQYDMIAASTPAG